MLQFLTRILLIGLCGGAGAILRYLVAGAIKNATGATFPLGTLIVNVTGCLAIGCLATLFFSDRSIVSPEFRDAVLIGVLGGYTTFSSFAWETLNLTDAGQFLYAATNVLLSVLLGLAAAWTGARLAQTLL